MAAYAVACDTDFQYGIQFGNHASAPDFDTLTWTALATSALPLEQDVVFQKNVRQYRPNRASGFRHNRYENVTNESQCIAPTCSMSLPATLPRLSDFLYGAFQSVTEAGGAPYKKDFVYPATAGHPDLSANAGAFFALVKKAASGSTSDQVIMSAIPRSLTLSCYPDQNNGRLTVQIEWTGRYHQEAQTYSGTLTYPTSWTYFNFADLKTTSFAGADVVLFGFTFTLANGMKQIPCEGYSASGKSCQNAAFPRFHTTGSVDVLWNATLAGNLAKEVGTDMLALAIAWGSGADPVTTTGDLLLKGSVKINSHSSVGNEESKRRIEFDCVEGSATEAFEAHICDNVDRSW